MIKVNYIITRFISGFNYPLPLVLGLHESTYRTFFPLDCVLFLSITAFKNFRGFAYTEMVYY